MFPINDNKKALKIPDFQTIQKDINNFVNEVKITLKTLISKDRNRFEKKDNKKSINNKIKEENKISLIAFKDVKICNLLSNPVPDRITQTNKILSNKSHIQKMENCKNLFSKAFKRK